MAQPQAHKYGNGNYRILGLADMASAIQTGRPHRASLEMARHVLEVMTGTLAAAEQGGRLTMTTTCDRPEALSSALPFGLLG